MAQAASSSAVAFMARLLRGRWFMLYGSFLIMSVAGATSAFAVYSMDIKASLGYTQEQLNTVGFFMDLGANFGVHAGLIAEVTPPWFVLAMGAVMNLGGYLMLYLSVAGRIGVAFKTPLCLVCLYIFVGANSQTFAHTGALVNCARSFPGSRGAMLGLLKGFLGLSGAIFSQLYLAFSGGRSSDTRPFILLVASLPAAISVALTGTIRAIPAPHQTTAAYREFRAFRWLLYLSLALAAYLMVAIIMQKRFHFNPTEYGLSAGIVVAMLLLPLVIVRREEAAAGPINETSQTTADGQQALSVAVAVADVATEVPVAPEAAMAAVNNRVRTLRCLRPRPPARGHDHTILDALVSVDMMLLLAATAFSVGGMLTAVYNIGQIGESLGYPQRSIATFVSLVSIWSYLGRVASGFGLDTAFVRQNLTSPLLMLVVLLLAIPGHLLIAFGVPGSLYPATMVIGFCYGATQPLILAIKSELFGLKYYSTICNLGPTVCPVGTCILNVLVAGRMYDKEAARQIRDVIARKVVATCIGVRCYRESFLIIAVATAAAAAVTATLAWRTWDFYAECRMGRSKAEMGVSDGGVVGEAIQQG